MSFDTAIEMLRKRAREDSEESEDEDEQSMIAQLDGNNDSVEGRSMSAVVEHRNQCHRKTNSFNTAQFRFLPS